MLSRPGERCCVHPTAAMQESRESAEAHEARKSESQGPSSPGPGLWLRERERERERKRTHKLHS